jgi:hypothetical protein
MQPLNDFYASPLVQGARHVHYSSDTHDQQGIKFVKVGKIRMTQKALIVSILGFLVFAFMVSMTFGPKGFMTATLFLTLALSNAYSVHCMEVGHCRIWSWVVVALVVLETASIIGLHVAVTLDKRHVLPHIQMSSPKLLF